MSARTQLVDKLTVALGPGYRVTGSQLLPSAVTRPTVGVWQQAVRRREEFGLNRVSVDIEVWVLVGAQDPEKADDALDDALMDVLAALQPIKFVEWSEARRGVLDATFHGYQLTATAVGTIGDE